MKIRIASLFALLLGIAAPAALAQQPLLSVSMVEIDLNGVPAFGANPTNIPPTVTGLPVNGGNGPYTDQITMWALATGTLPEGGFTYTFFVNGVEIGNAINVVPPTPTPTAPAPTPPPTTGFAQAVSWTPPQPGVYYFSVSATDGTHTAVSLPIEFFATGISIVSPVANVILPIGSSVVIQAAAAVTDGAVSKVEFFADGVSLGTSSNYPYSIIYTPAGPAGTVHFIRAQSYLADGVTFAATTPLQGIVMVAAVGPIPTCSIGSPPATTPPTTIPIPNYVANSGANIQVTVNAASPTGKITQVQLYINGVLFGTITGTPYSFIWQPTVTGTYNLTALAYDEKDNVVASTTSVAATLTPAPTTVIVGSLPSVEITAPSNGATLSGSSSITVSATDTNVDILGNPIPIKNIDFYQDGTHLGSVAGVAGQSVYTISFIPVPRVNATTGVIEDSILTAIASDTLGFSATSTGVEVTVATGGSTGGVSTGTPPTISLTAPAPSSSVVVNTPVTLSATASAPNGNVKQVTFSVDSNTLSTATQYPYSVVWTPANLGFYTISAQVTDNMGDTTNSTPITVFVVPEPEPTISISAPTTGATVTFGTPIKVTASANSPEGTISQVQFFENGISIGTATTPPYSISFTPLATGNYAFTAQVTDNVGDKVTSAPVTVTIVPQPPPVVSISSPATGGIVTVGTAITVSAGATSPTGTISQVQFYENGILIGASSTPPYSISFTPQSTGIYTLTAVATDNSGEVTTSTTVDVEAAPVSSGVGTLIYFGNYQGLTESGRFAFATSDGVLGTYIGISTTVSKNPVAFYQDLAVSSGGSFSSSSITGVATALGVSGSLSPSGDIFIGGVAQATSVAVATGYYTGDLVGQANSELTAIVGADGEIMVYVADGSFTDAGYGSFGAVGSNGAFSVTTVGNNTISGTINPSTGFMTGTLSGGPGGSILAARVSGGTFSDGVLKNISTRGDVGTGANIMIAGFVVGGTSSKHLLVRAVGPALTGLGVSGAIAATQLQVYSGASIVAANTGWSSTATNAAQVAAAESTAGAFTLTAGSADSALVGSYAPGAYTATVTGVGSDTGIALVEVYDLDAFSPFTANKLVNVSTRGFVGTGADVLIGGFVINGTLPKRLLIRAAGPGLASMSVSGALAAPRLQLFNSSEVVIRENFSWQTGNDPGLISAAEAVTGAFAFANSSADSAILVVLPPGSYTVQVSGAAASTGVALVEVYEVP